MVAKEVTGPKTYINKLRDALGGAATNKQVLQQIIEAIDGQANQHNNGQRTHLSLEVL